MYLRRVEVVHRHSESMSRLIRRCKKNNRNTKATITGDRPLTTGLSTQQAIVKRSPSKTGLQQYHQQCGHLQFIDNILMSINTQCFPLLFSWTVYFLFSKKKRHWRARERKKDNANHPGPSTTAIYFRCGRRKGRRRYCRICFALKALL